MNTYPSFLNLELAEDHVRFVCKKGPLLCVVYGRLWRVATGLRSASASEDEIKDFNRFKKSALAGIYQVSVRSDEMISIKDNEIAKLVSDLKNIAIMYCASGQLRERIAARLVPVIRGIRSPEGPNAGMGIIQLSEETLKEARRYRWFRVGADYSVGSPRVVCGDLDCRSYTSPEAMDADVDRAMELADFNG